MGALWGARLRLAPHNASINLLNSCRLGSHMVESKPLGLDSHPDRGGMAEWTKAAVLKTAVGLTAHRGFESLSLRLEKMSIQKFTVSKVSILDRS